MNTKQLSLLFFLCITNLLTLNARDRLKNLNRIESALLIAEKQSDLTKQKAQAEYKSLLKTPAGEYYEKALLLCKKQKNCQNCELFQQAVTDLKSTKEYQENYLPLYLDDAYWSMRKSALEKMIFYVNAEVRKDDFEAMHAGIHSALYVDTKITAETVAIREQVYNELCSLIEKEQAIMNVFKNSKK